jgi:hypothetical protein
MTRRLLICLSVLAAAALVAPGAWAAKPATERFVADESFELPAGEVCSFLLQFDFDQAGRISTFSDGRTVTHARGTIQVTNGLTGESVSLHVGASTVDTPLPNGDLRSTTRGQSLLFYLEGDVLGPGLFLTKGHVVEIFDAITGSITSSRLNGQRTDVCALLS